MFAAWTRKGKKFLSLPWVKKRLMLEALFFLGWARLLKALPFSRIAPSLGSPMTETPLAHDPSDETPIRQISSAVRTPSRHTLWESRCLVQAIAAKKMLERRRIESTLYLGTAKDERGRLIAHAWLRSGPFFVTGAESMRNFTTVAVFGPGRKRREE